MREYNDDYIDIECPLCGGYIYRYGIYADLKRPYRCVRCEAKYSESEYNNLFNKKYLFEVLNNV